MTFFQVCLVECHLVAQVECFFSFNQTIVVYTQIFAEHAQIGHVWSCDAVGRSVSYVMVMCTKMAMFLGSSKVMKFFRVKVSFSM